MLNRSMLMISKEAFSALNPQEINAIAKTYINNGNTSTGDALKAASKILSELKL
ncbi:MAG TPA: hypothetical protein PKX38_02830 [Alphaproteobacteria bacterium]|jgi:hypothetical protein|nr:hypothetical protein [Micavibrio sp.]MBK9562161.1 hypothetical protein [Micavibrio sp.]HQX26853.1 hypothetical protein [Alphaproteobacteria bacterium]